MKRVSIYSFGFSANQPLSQIFSVPFFDAPNIPLSIFDLRMIVPDTYRGSENGQNQAVQDFFLQVPEFSAFIESQRVLLNSARATLSRGKGTFNGLRLYFGCDAGYRRSVAAAEIIYRLTGDMFSNSVELSIQHLALPFWSKFTKK